MLTPYAVLLVRPSDSDELIRQAFHSLSRQHHPDKFVTEPQPEASSQQWFAATAAYGAINSQGKRDNEHKRMHGLSGVCSTCDGSGVQGSRSAGSKIRVCDKCKGEGRLR